MKKLVLAAGLAALICSSAVAQDNPRAEVSGGFSYLHAGPGSNLYGWDGSVAGNLNGWFGIVGEFSGHYTSSGAAFSILTPIIVVLGPTPPVVTVKADSNLYTFLFGPRFSYRRNKRFTPFAYILPGFARSHVNVNGTVTSQGALPTNFHVSDSSTAFAMAIGGGLDVKLTRSLAFRVLQADYLLTRFGEATQNDARLTTGLVFRFGR